MNVSDIDARIKYFQEQLSKNTREINRLTSINSRLSKDIWDLERKRDDISPLKAPVMEP